jgi:hypothetical protein
VGYGYTGRETPVAGLLATSACGAAPVSTHDISGVSTSKVRGVCVPASL